MQSNYPAAILANFDGDFRKAYEHLSKAYLALERQHCEEGGSRFIQISKFESDSEICLRKITETQISRAVDMADCEDPGIMRKWLYVDDSGSLQLVTIGSPGRINQDEDMPFYYASSSIMANGECVGSVTYTDH